MSPARSGRAGEEKEFALTDEHQEKKTLAGAAARGGFIVGLAGALEQASQFLRAIILARFLSPDEFGLMGMAFIAIRAGESLSQTGFSRALVQKRGDAISYLDTVWAVSVVRGMFLFGLGWLLAPLVGAFFKTPEVIPVLKFAATALLIQGFVNPGVYVLERELRFSRQAIPGVAGAVAELVTAVTLALMWRSVWAMVWGYVIGKLVHMISTYIVWPYLPRFRVKWNQVREFRKYGRHIFRGRAIDYVVSQLDRLLIGRLLGPAALGLYSVGWRMASVPATGLYNAVFRVAFPVFSKIQGESDRIRVGFLRALGLLAAMAAPISIGLWVVAGDFVAVALHDKWEGMVPAMRILCLAGFAQALNYLMGAVLSAVGRPDVAVRGSYFLFGAMVIPIYPATLWLGIEGAAWCVCLGSVVATTYLVSASSRILDCKIRRIIKALAAPILGACAMGITVFQIRTTQAGAPNWTILMAEILGGMIIFAIAAALFDRLLKGGLVLSMKAAFASVMR
jgi:lipopolysaccharide exporter